ncbi:hypothetical protein N9A70_02730, partial [Akkermansiaceae bacterium]|nr:hypothetical protein [Akkermansiaceae bacterium]
MANSLSMHGKKNPLKFDTTINAISKKGMNYLVIRRKQPDGSVFRSSSLSAFFYNFDCPRQFQSQV